MTQLRDIFCDYLERTAQGQTRSVWARSGVQSIEMVCLRFHKGRLEGRTCPSLSQLSAVVLLAV